MDENVYSPPKSNLTDATNTIPNLLASRWQRLGASILDGLIMTLVVSPVMYLTGGFDVFRGIKPALTYTFSMAVFSWVVFIVVNGKFLLSNGQTVGKKILDIKIVDMDGNLPTVKDHLIKRYAVYFIPGQIPLIGGLLSLVNILFIFGPAKRCVHDYLGGTKVVSV